MRQQKIPISPVVKPATVNDSSIAAVIGGGGVSSFGRKIIGSLSSCRINDINRSNVSFIPNHFHARSGGWEAGNICRTIFQTKNGSLNIVL